MKTIFLKLNLMVVLCCLACISCDKKYDPEPPEPEPVSWMVARQATLTKAQFLDSLCSANPSIADVAKAVAAKIPDAMKYKVVSFYYADILNGEASAQSASLVFPESDARIPASIILANRATQLSNSDVPSNKLNMENVLAFFTPVVMADLPGYGISSDKLSYCCKHTAVSSTLSALIAAMEMLHTEEVNPYAAKVPAKLSTINVGYSQGGYDALAFHRYMEVEAPQVVKDMVDLYNTNCGAGPYELTKMLDVVFSRESYGYPQYVLTAFMSLMNWHPQKFTVPFTPDYLITDKLRNIQLVNRINGKKEDNTTLMREVAYALGNDFSLANAFDARLLDKSGEIYKSLYAASADDGLLDGWQPKIRIKFFHATNDDCVPVECTRKAQEVFDGNKNVRFEYDDTPAQQFLHSAMQVKFYQNVIKEIYGMNSGL